MKEVILSNKELYSLPLFIDKKTNEGSIFLYDSENLLKYFSYLTDNKHLTIDLIEKNYDSLSKLPFLLFHNRKVFVDNELKGIIIKKGYEVPLYKYINLPSTTFNDKIIVLKNIGKALESLRILRENNEIVKNFFIGDIHEKNILVNPETREIQFIDLDSCKIENNKAVLCKYLQFFKTYQYVVSYLSRKYPKQDNHIFSNNHATDLYCYHAMIMNILFNEKIYMMDIQSFYNYIYELQAIGLPKELCESLQGLYIPGENINPYKSLDKIPEIFENKLILKKI